MTSEDVVWVTTPSQSGIQSQSNVINHHLNVTLLSCKPLGINHTNPVYTDEHGLKHPTQSLTDALLHLAPDLVVFHPTNNLVREALPRVQPYMTTALRLGVNLRAEYLSGKYQDIPKLINAFQQTDHIISSGTHATNTLKALNYDLDRVTEIPSMIDTSRAREPPETSPNNIGVIGRVDRAKNQFLAFQTLVALDRMDNELQPQLLLAGNENDPTLNMIKESVQHIGRVKTKYLGFVPNPLEGFYPYLGVHLHPSYTENCPQTVLEAAVCGIPTVATTSLWTQDFDALPKSHLDNPVGLAECVYQLLSNDDTRIKVTRAQQEMVREFDVREVVPLYEALFSELVDSYCGLKVSPEVKA